MENAIPSLLIGALLLIASAFMAGSGIRTYDQLGASLKAMESRIGEQSQTRLSIANPTLQADVEGILNGWHRLTLDLANEGQTRMAAFERLDVIVTYYTSPTDRISVWLPYVNGATQPNTWTVISISNDTYEPGIVNSGETAHIEIKVSPRVQPLKTNLIVISSNAGSTVSAPFTS